MNKKMISLLLIILIIGTGVSFADENNTTYVELTDEQYEIPQEDMLSDESQINATGSGIRNITFGDGYNGYCINMTKDHAEEGSTFTPKSTQYAMNNKYNTTIGNYLKILFVDFYDFATKDASETSEVIWDFSDRYYLDSNNEITQAILKLANEGRIIPDHGQTKQINNTTQATFDFEVFNPLNDDLQNYFGYKITLSRLMDNNNNSTENTTYINESEDNVSVGNLTGVDDFEDNVSVGNLTGVDDFEDNVSVGNLTGVDDFEDNVSVGNLTGDVELNHNGSNIQSMMKSTGNPILLFLISMIIGVIRITKK